VSRDHRTLFKLKPLKESKDLQVLHIIGPILDDNDDKTQERGHNWQIRVTRTPVTPRQLFPLARHLSDRILLLRAARCVCAA
jgi:hypothetical protein